jgi:hypothetical protein
VIEPNVFGALITKTPAEYYANGEVPKIPFICSMTSRELELSLGVYILFYDTC